ncbi:hypothetical protein PSACC_03519 [Paramicrosporidium saccamoebae]|uniref:Uncharacterized protein n=1 Tax=Paramicrosporidium saccamoebae TaxID=1246581 RepID=A0A2H9TG24_9FUNG|nr:hypothetical protein PSACC_03519 [Paramicrosporidium saccamoebae]
MFPLLLLLRICHLCIASTDASLRRNSFTLSPHNTQRAQSNSPHSPHSPHSLHFTHSSHSIYSPHPVQNPSHSISHSTSQSRSRSRSPRVGVKHSTVIKSVSRFITRLKSHHFEWTEHRRLRALTWRGYICREESSEMLKVFAEEYFKILADHLAVAIEENLLSHEDFKFLIREGFSDILLKSTYCGRRDTLDEWPPLLDLVDHAAMWSEESFLHIIFHKKQCLNNSKVRALLENPKFWNAAFKINANTVTSYAGEYLGAQAIKDLKARYLYE